MREGDKLEVLDLDGKNMDPREGESGHGLDRSGSG